MLERLDGPSPWHSVLGRAATPHRCNVLIRRHSVLHPKFLLPGNQYMPTQALGITVTSLGDIDVCKSNHGG
jgi:hypothetical protein